MLTERFYFCKWVDLGGEEGIAPDLPILPGMAWSWFCQSNLDATDPNYGKPLYRSYLVRVLAEDHAPILAHPTVGIIPDVPLSTRLGDIPQETLDQALLVLASFGFAPIGLTWDHTFADALQMAGSQRDPGFTLDALRKVQL